MFWTIVLSIAIFGGAGWVIFNRITGCSSKCEDCKCGCSVKENTLLQQSNMRLKE